MVGISFTWISDHMQLSIPCYSEGIGSWTCLFPWIPKPTDAQVSYLWLIISRVSHQWIQRADCKQISLKKRLPRWHRDKESVCNAKDEGDGRQLHSSMLAWTIPRTEEPGELQSMRSQSWTQLSTRKHAQKTYWDIQALKAVLIFILQQTNILDDW